MFIFLSQIYDIFFNNCCYICVCTYMFISITKSLLTYHRLACTVSQGVNFQRRSFIFKPYLIVNLIRGISVKRSGYTFRTNQTSLWALMSVNWTVHLPTGKAFYRQKANPRVHSQRLNIQLCFMLLSRAHLFLIAFSIAIYIFSLEKCWED